MVSITEVIVMTKPASHEQCEHSPEAFEPTGKKVVARLRRIEGQVRGLQKMVEDDRYCPDIMNQVAAVQESLRSTAEVLLRNHLRHCVSDAISSSSPGRAEAVYEELAGLFRKFAR